MVYSFLIIENEQFVKLKKESQEIEFDNNDKITLVLSKNIETALNQKGKAAEKLFKLKEELNNDHSIKVIKIKIDSKNQKDLLEISKNTVNLQTCEDIPEEVDCNIFQIQSPKESTKFINIFKRSLKQINKEIKPNQGYKLNDSRKFSLKYNDVKKSEAELKLLPGSTKTD